MAATQTPIPPQQTTQGVAPAKPAGVVATTAVNKNIKVAPKKVFKTILYLTQKTLTVIKGTDPKTPSIATINFIPQAMLDGEIIDIHELIKQLSAFFMQQQLQELHYSILVGSDFVYRKDIKNASISKMEKEAQDFIDAIPHEYVLSRVFRLPKSTVVAAINKDVVRTIDDELKKNECIRDNIAITELSEDIKKILATGLTLEASNKLLQKYNGLRQWSMIEVDETGGIWNADLGGGDDEDSSKTTTSLIKAQSNTMLYGGVFAALLVILGVVFLLTKPKPSTSTATTISSSSETVVASSSASLVANASTAQSLAIIIVSSTTNTISAKTIEDGLKEKKYMNITSKAAQTSPAKTTVMVRKNISQDIFDTLTSDINLIASGSAIKQQDKLESDVIIEVGK